MESHPIRTDSNVPMGDPIAFFITWPTYGTWLPGDERGWVEYHDGWQLPRPPLELECGSRMTEDACILSPQQRDIVERQVAETCGFRGWVQHAAVCRSNHVHVVIGPAGSDAKKIRREIKAWCTRRLKEGLSSTRENWWGERGSIRWIWNDESLETVVRYVTEAQDRKNRDDQNPQ